MKLTSMTNSAMLRQLNLRIEQLHAIAPDSVGDQFRFQAVDCDVSRGEYVLRCETFPWMRNAYGTLHGGSSAAMIDQAMGFVAYCMKPGEGFTPTIELQLSYHRPIMPGEDALIRIKTVSQSQFLMHFQAEVFQVSNPEKLCVTGNSVYFYKAEK